LAYKKPPAAGAPKEVSAKPTVSDTTKQTTKQANEQESKAGVPKGKAIAGRDSNQKKQFSCIPHVLSMACARCLWPANRRKQARCYQ
jgi:hypothetical protein